ncbi:MAG: hypothetical protein GY830_08395 [Bacteroidetes bacterium]|nr:hypothetical protein [Bacteroidota bacterium]
MNWIRSFGEQVKAIKSKNKIEKMEMDEMHTYVSKKTTNGYVLIGLEKNSLILLLGEEI